MKKVFSMKLTDEYILRQPEKYQAMILHVISVVEQELDSNELLFKWGIPYIYFKKKHFVIWLRIIKKDF